MEETLVDVQSQRDQAYFERNQLVAYLTGIYPAFIAQWRDDGEGSDWFLVVVYLPECTATWHVHKREFQYFRHLTLLNDFVWDGLTTEEKYRRMNPQGYNTNG